MRAPDGWGVVSSLALLAELHGPGWELDPVAAVQLCRVGYPLAHRTLFRGVTRLPAGRVVRLGPEGDPVEESAWAPEAEGFATREEHTAHMVARFGEVLARLDTADTRFSLSGGLDTRAIFAGLAEHGRLPECFTVSGPRTSLDAVLARDLCRAYGVSHRIVRLDVEFLATLWDDARAACRLSGGVASLWSAPQVYCYRRLGLRRGDSAAVLSGFLGNQVGRGSTEGVSSRPVDLAILGEALRDRVGAGDLGAGWHRRGRGADGRFHPRFLIQEENAHASLAAYAVGEAHAIQRSPYSDLALLAGAVCRPPVVRGRRSRLDPRVREVIDRFRGVGHGSFQRTFIAGRGGPVAHHPINYGWTAAGTPSARGLYLGLRAFAEDVLTVSARRSRAAARLQRLSRLDGFATHLYADRWLTSVREPLQDLLGSREIREAGILDIPASRRALTQFLRDGRSRLETVIAVMDLALLIRTFGVRLR